MGHAIPKQHPAVVLRSQFNLVRALLGVAMVALVGLTIALVIVANENDELGSTQAIEAAPAVPNASSLPAFPSPAPAAPGTRYDGGPEEGTRGPLTAPATPNTRYDGGPEEGTRGPLTAPATPNTRYDGGPEEGTRGPLTSSATPNTRYDGGPEEGTRGPGFPTN